MNKNQTLEILRKQLGLTKKEFSNAIGITQNAYTNYIQGKRDIPTSVALTIKQMYDVDLDWLLTGKGDIKGICDNKNEIEVNLFEDIYASAGYGATNSNIKPKKTTLSQAFVESLHIRNPKNIDIIRIIGDSMSPVFEDGEYVVVERVSDISEVNNGNTIIANIDRELYIKKIKKEPLTKKIYLLSNNEFYEPIELKDELLKDFNLIGIVRGKYRAI